MDIFSIGCVIAELFLETPIFTLSQLLQYRKGDYDPETVHLHRLEDKDVRELISHMIQLDPESRFSADEYLEFWRGKAFPEYFAGFLHQYMALITDPSSGKSSITSDDTNLGESDDRIARIYYDYDKIAYFLEYLQLSNTQNGLPSPSQEQIFPIHVDLPRPRTVSKLAKTSPVEDGTYLFLGVITSSLRSTARSSARLQACDLFLAFAEHISDEAKLDRVLPFVVTLVDDRSDVVKITALRTMAQLMSMITSTSPVNAFVFPEYLIPKLTETFQTRRSRRPHMLVRVTFAQCVAALAESAAKFLDSMEALKSEGALPSTGFETSTNLTVATYQDFYDSVRADLVRFFEGQAKALLTDAEAPVRRAFLGSIAGLCIFFGSAKTNDVILSHLNTYLNDRDWRLKCSFFESIVGVAIYVGASNLEEFVLPLMLLSLVDPEESVIRSVLQSLATIGALGLFQKATLWKLIDLIGRFLVHPNVAIREASVRFVASSTQYLSTADRQCILMPIVNIFLKFPPSTFDEMALMDTLKIPINRDIYEIALSWAGSASDSRFWTDVKRLVESLKRSESLVARSSKGLNATSFAKIPKNDTDQQWLSRMRIAGLKREDEVKLIALSEIIWRIANRPSVEVDVAHERQFEKQLRLAEAGAQINTFQLDAVDDLWNKEAPPHTARNEAVENIPAQPQTISDALLDASATIGVSDQVGTIEDATEALDRRDRERAESSVSSRLGSQDQAPGSSQSSTSAMGSTNLHAKPAVHQFSQQANVSADKRHTSTSLIKLPRNGSKASPETGTSTTNALGRVDNSIAKKDSNHEQEDRTFHAQRRRLVHPKLLAEGGYKGRDPHVIHLLESVALTNHPPGIDDFGSEVIPYENQMTHIQSDAASSQDWRPTGSVIATLSEHTGPISRLIVSPDHLFFLTASDDGSVKVWDTNRLERNVTSRSRLTFKVAPGVKVTALCMIGNTHNFACAGSDGSIQIVRVGCEETSHSATKYSKPTLLRPWALPNASQAHATWLEYKKMTSGPTLFISTSTCEFYALDLALMTVAYKLDNPKDHGLPTCFCLGQENDHWMLMGTSNGVLDLWDLRFHVHLRSFAFPNCGPIHRLLINKSAPSHGDYDAPIVYVAGGTRAADITAWNIQELKCIEVWRAYEASEAYEESREHLKRSTVTMPDMKSYIAWKPDAGSQHHKLERFQKEMESKDQEGETEKLEQNFLSSLPRDNSVNSIALGTRAAGRDTSSQLRGDAPYFVAAGPDNNLRFWDLRKGRISESCVITKPSKRGDGVRITASSFEQVGTYNGILLNEERLPEVKEKAKTTGRRGDTQSASRKATTRRQREEDPKGSTAKLLKQRVQSLEDSAIERGVSHPSGISDRTERQLLLEHHLDKILDVAIIERPYRMFVSVDRSGVIFVRA